MKRGNFRPGSVNHCVPHKPAPAKTETVFQWMKILIVDGMSSGTLSIPPPVLARVFHELDIAVGKFQTACALSEVPFYFPYAATMDLIMLIHTLVTPIVMMNLLPSSVFLPLPVVFLVLFLVWSLHLVAGELENPYDCDRNDMDLHLLQVICEVHISQVPELTVEVEMASALLAKSRASRALLVKKNLSTTTGSEVTDIARWHWRRGAMCSVNRDASFMSHVSIGSAASRASRARAKKGTLDSTMFGPTFSEATHPDLARVLDDAEVAVKHDGGLVFDVVSSTLGSVVGHCFQ